MNFAPLALAPLALALCACATVQPREPASFWSALSSHCGNAYRGALASEDARDAAFRGQPMIAHWAQCSDTRIAIAFHIYEGDAQATSSSSEAVGHEGGWNRSRTWIVTREGPGAPVTLKHDHRHADSEADAVTFYGGTSDAAGTARARDFPVDAESIALFGRPEHEGAFDASLTNVWRIEVDPAHEPDAQFVYQLTRRGDPSRLFRVVFDASEPMDSVPPPAWGW
ncbi:hypothetical protein [Alteriqipengyuania lutimaris]|uniref:Secreted protein n=1 Tax=Alteriqipengyuania lutimaris TaxID=1538146 RepID=A0A395LN88_9SPHN|nr:hypothetical protein [Alteriqipengyuania lutimaris]MBB3034089.1 hypothetical protein [Alteriqipengyuania lutimaris]RDS76974.1 hypothetical protein DL238_04695 [Alteriqipengyuania lutimaris]